MNARLTGLYRTTTALALGAALLFGATACIDNIGLKEYGDGTYVPDSSRRAAGDTTTRPFPATGAEKMLSGTTSPGGTPAPGLDPMDSVSVDGK